MNTYDIVIVWICEPERSSHFVGAVEPGTEVANAVEFRNIDTELREQINPALVP